MKMLLIIFFLYLSLILLVVDSYSGPSAQKKESNSHQASIVDMAYVSGGKFTMGLTPQTAFEECKKYNLDCDLNWFLDEGPPHLVEVGSFYIDTYEVTQKDFQSAMGRNPSKYKGEDLPVESVTWHDANDYCQKVGKRLPTEAEWEYAAKGGQDTIYPWGNEMASDMANLCDKSCLFVLDLPSVFEDGYATTAQVGSFPPNGYGLYDMTGNVQEWVTDWYDKNYYHNSPENYPKGPPTGSEKTIRGGSWDREPDSARVSERSEAHPKLKDFNLGFRCVLDIQVKPSNKPKQHQIRD